MNRLSHIDIGQIGEKAALEWYTTAGYVLVAKNYRRRFGEIDLIVRKGDELVFVEVKSVSCVSFGAPHRNPAENIHHRKRGRLRKILVDFLKGYEEKHDSWRFDVALVRVNVVDRVSRVEVLENIIL